MKFGHCLLSTALLFPVCMAWAQTPAAPEPRNIVQLSANGTLEAQQDWLTLTLSSTRDGIEPGAVQSQLRQTLDAALAEVKKSAQAGALEVHSGAFSLQPRYGKDGRINGWVGTSELVLEGGDFARIGSAAAKAQSMTIGNLVFSLSRKARTELEAQAQSLAIAGFKAKASEIARGFGFGDYGLREVNVNVSDGGGGPMPRVLAMNVRGMASDAAVPMESGKSLVVVTVSGAVQLK